MPRVKSSKKKKSSADKEPAKKKKPAARRKKRETVKKPLDYNMEVEKRAYEIFQERSGKQIPGDHMSDWTQAENEIRSKYKIV
jgi:hypothetical protein